MERENANFETSFQSLRNDSAKVVHLQAPIGSQQNFKGVVDLLTMTAITDDGTSQEISGKFER